MTTKSGKCEKKKLITLADFDEYAKNNLSHAAYVLFSSGAEEEFSAKDNIEAFKRVRIRPRMMRDVSTIDTTTSILGMKIAFPVCVAPSGYHVLAHTEAEIATARGTVQSGVIFCQSSHSSYSMKELTSKVLSHSSVLETDDYANSLFFQLFILKDRERTLRLVKTAEACGFKAIVLTVDTPYISRKYWHLRNEDEINAVARVSFAEFPEYDKTIPEEELIDNTVTWSDVKWLRNHVNVKFIIKGIMTEPLSPNLNRGSATLNKILQDSTRCLVNSMCQLIAAFVHRSDAEDAKLALETGCDAIIVSNHGGRQLDYTLSTLDALLEVIEAVAGKCEVYMDGGVRLGSDVFKALALGAKVHWETSNLWTGLQWQ